MNKFALSFALLPLASSVFAADSAASPLSTLFKNTKANAEFSLGGETIDGNMNTSRILTTKVKVNATHKFTSDLKFNFKGGFKLEEGTYDRKSVISNGPEPSNRWQLSESSLDYTLYDTLNLVGGALAQSRFASPILLGSSAFLAAYEQLQWNSKNKRFHISVFAEQAYASNRDLASTLPDYYSDGHSYKAEDHLPKFFTEGLQIRYTGKKIKFHVWGGHWAYDKLGKGIAIESVHLGNTASNPSATAAGDVNFRYKYKGWNGAFYFDVPFIAESRMVVGGEFVMNDDAPSHANKGYGASMTFKVPGKKIGWETYVRYLDIDPDASVAYFSGVDNNRKIYNVGVGFNKADSNLFFGFDAIHSDVKVKNPYMSDENKFSFVLGTSVNLL